MNDALFRANPAKLAIVDEITPSFAPVSNKGGEGAATEAFGDLGDGCTDDIIATAYCESLLS